MKPDNCSRFWLDGAGRIARLTPAEEIHLGATVRRWQDFAGGPDAAPSSVQRRGLKARNRIVEANLRLVHMVATRIKSRAPMADMMQSGTLGLIRAAEKFDPERGYKFSTYAYFWILQSIKRGEVDEFTISLPGLVIERVKAGRESELSAATRLAGRLAYSVKSLDVPMAFSDGDGEHLGDMIAGSCLDAADIGWGDALAAMQATDPDGMALLSLAGVDRATLGELGAMEGVSAKVMAHRIRETRARLMTLPEVGACLVG